MIATLGFATLITGDIASKTVSATINVLSNTLTYMTTNSGDDSIKKYKQELETIDIKFKLDIIQEWLATTQETEDEKTNKLYESIIILCKDLTDELERIEKKINTYKSLWLRNWRTLDLNDEIFKIKQKCLILNERLILITFLQYGKR